MKKLSIFAAALLFMLLARDAGAQTCIPLGGANPSVYTQNFDALGPSSAPQAGDTANITVINATAPRRYLGRFQNAISDTGGTVNMPGWAIYEEGSGTSSVTGRYAVGDGSGTGGNTFSFGSSALPGDRAFGSLSDDAFTLSYVGGCFINNTASALTAVRIGFTGEMWRRGGGAVADRLDFQFSTNATNIYSGTFTDFNAFDFASLDMAGSSGARDGNAAAYRTVYPLTNMPVSIPAGGTLHIRWGDLNLPGQADDGLAIDDFRIELIPPSAAAVTVSGRVLTAGGRGISGARLVLESPDGSRRLATTNPFGFYRFDELSAGGTYVVTVTSKTHTFSGSPRVISVNDNIFDLDFTSVY